MRPYILVVENFNGGYGVTLEEIRDTFGGTHLICAKSNGNSFRIQNDGGVRLSDGARNAKDPYSFYHNLLSNSDENSYVLRVNAPNYPLHKLLWSEIQEQFPAEKYPYVLSTGEECALQGYFAERISRRCLDFIEKQSIKVMPTGYFNASLMDDAGRHWFSLALRRYYYQEKFETLFDSPRSLCVNAIGTCNYTCQKCQYHSSKLPRNREYEGAMPIEHFKEILSKAKSYKRLRQIYPTITGEPLLHPNIVEIVRLVRDAGYGCSFTTNASLLDQKMTDALIDAGVGSLAFSVDATDPALYQRLQAGGSLVEVEKNILYFQERFSRKYGNASCSLNYVVSEENEDMRQAFLERWQKRGFYVQFSTCHDIFDSYRPYFDQSEWGPEGRRPCAALWHGLYLTHQGRAVSCGAMAKTLGIKENIFEMDPAKLWRCEALQILREQQLTGVKPGYCKEFTCWTGMINTWVADGTDVLVYSKGYTQHVPNQKVSHPTGLKEVSVKALRAVKRIGLTILERSRA